ncbi:MAG: hypothetical protein JWO38_5094 [Gemmataceae bacterium]|nr:hypothetical protein [Gemmataceae bacterium]
MEILTRLADSQTRMLHFVRVGLEAGFAVLIDVKEITNPRDVDAAMPYIEGVPRLEQHGLLLNPTRDGQVYHLRGTGVRWRRGSGGSAPGARGRW